MPRDENERVSEDPLPLSTLCLLAELESDATLDDRTFDQSVVCWFWLSAKLPPTIYSL